MQIRVLPGALFIMYKCKFCDIEFDKPNLVAGHVRWCLSNPNRVISKKKSKQNDPLLRRCHSEETKKLLSEKRKAYLASNPENHNWSRYSNKESLPEQKFRELLEKSNLKLKQYYIPPESNRFYEIDFAHVESKTGFEINGNQHYNSDGTLKDYYKERQQHFINLGWKIVEIHYSLCFKEEVISSIISLSFSDFKLCQDKVQEIDNARLERRAAKLLKKISNKERKGRHSNKRKSYHLSRRKVERPSKEELKKMLWETPTVQLAKKFGVSDKAIEKWAKAYNLEKPARGYWEKLKASN